MSLCVCLSLITLNSVAQSTSLGRHIHVHLPPQSSTLQSTVLFCLLFPVQSAPPNCGTGLVHVRSRVLVALPPPHRTVHLLVLSQSFQSDHPPSTVRRIGDRLKSPPAYAEAPSTCAITGRFAIVLVTPGFVNYDW